MKQIYKNIPNVIFKIEDIYRDTFVTGLWGLNYTTKEKVPENEQTYYIIFNSMFNKYMITNDIVKHGLNSEINNVEIVGQATSIDYAMFCIYEHQVSRNEQVTIYDELKKYKSNKPEERIHTSLINEWADEKASSKIVDWSNAIVIGDSSWSSFKIEGIDLTCKKDKPEKQNKKKKRRKKKGE
jgi:hypothetical protein